MQSYYLMFFLSLITYLVSAQSPSVSEDFSAGVTYSFVNGTINTMGKGMLYSSYSSQKKRLDVQVQSVAQMVIERYDQSPRWRYIVQNNVCDKERISKAVQPMWGWLTSATHVGSCVIDTRHGEQWVSQSDSPGNLACIQKENLPLELVTTEDSATTVLVFATWNTTKPVDTVFTIPKTCAP